MDSRQKPAITPLKLLGTRMKFASENEAFAFQRSQRGINFSDRQLKQPCDLCRCDRTDYFHSAAHEFADRIGSLPLAFTFTRRRNQKRLNLAIGIDGSQDWESLCCDPEMASRGLRP